MGLGCGALVRLVGDSREPVSLSLSATRGHSEKDAICKPRGRSSPNRSMLAAWSHTTSFHISGRINRSQLIAVFPCGRLSGLRGSGRGEPACFRVSACVLNAVTGAENQR